MAEAQERTAGDLVVKTFPPAFGGRLIVEIQTIDGASIAEIDTLHSTKADKEIAAKIVKRFNGYPKAIEALKAAEQFIVNGVEFGFIRLPDSDCPDPAHDTLPKIRAVLSDLGEDQ